MENAKIEFKIKINLGSFQGQIIDINTDIEELEEDGLSTILVDKGYLEYWCNNDEYEVVGRKITIIN